MRTNRAYYMLVAVITLLSVLFFSGPLWAAVGFGIVSGLIARDGK